jgi:hypothetical protein
MDIVNSEIAVSNVAGSLGVEQSTVQRYLEGSASIFERWQIDKRKLSRFTSEQIFRLAQRGNVLIRGWGANALFRDIPQVISVRICPLRANDGETSESLKFSLEGVGQPSHGHAKQRIENEWSRWS